MAVATIDLTTLILAGNEPEPTPEFSDGRPVRAADGSVKPKLDRDGRKDYRVMCAIPSDSPNRAFDDVAVHVAADENPVAGIAPHSVVAAKNPVISFGQLSGGRGQWWRIDAAGIEAAK